MTATPYLELRETHSAGLLLVGGTVLKFTKPVDLGFLDFTAVETRSAVCAAEVELNRRFAPDVYLGVADLALPDGRHEPVVGHPAHDHDRLVPASTSATTYDTLPTCWSRRTDARSGPRRSTSRPAAIGCGHGGSPASSRCGPSRTGSSTRPRPRRSNG